MLHGNFFRLAMALAVFYSTSLKICSANPAVTFATHPENQERVVTNESNSMHGAIHALMKPITAKLQQTIDMLRCSLSSIVMQRELAQAAADANVATVRYLLGLGCLDVNWRDENEYESCGGADLTTKNGTALHRVIQCRGDEPAAVDVVRLLIESGADVNMTESFWGYTPLIIAAELGHLQVARFLLENGADVNSGNKIGWTALMMAAVGNNLDMASLLLEKGSIVNASDDAGWTALMLAAGAGNLKTVSLLLEKGSDIDAKDDEGLTVLMWTVSGKSIIGGRLEIVKLLLLQGANVNSANNKGSTALSIATENGHSEFVKLLSSKMPISAD